MNVPLWLCDESVHVPLITAGVLEVSKFPVQEAEPAVPLYTVPEVRAPDIVKVWLWLSVPLPVTLPFAPNVAVQVPELPPLNVPVNVPATTPRTVFVISACAAAAVTSVAAVSDAPDLMVLTAACSCASVAVEKSSDKPAAAVSSPAVIVNEPLEASVVLIVIRNRVTAITEGVDALAVGSVDCAQLTGVIMA